MQTIAQYVYYANGSSKPLPYKNASRFHYLCIP